MFFTHDATQWSKGWGVGVWTIKDYEVVLVTATRRVDTEKGKPDRDRPSRRSNNGPFTMSVVRVTARKARVGEYPFVAQKSPSTACKERMGKGSSEIETPSSLLCHTCRKHPIWKPSSWLKTPLGPSHWIFLSQWLVTQSFFLWNCSLLTSGWEQTRKQCML